MTTIAHISDLHFGRVDPSAAESLVTDVQQVRPDLTVISGDLTQRARRAQFAAARQFLERLPSPQLIVPGNHDVPLYDVLRRWISPFGRFYSCFGEERLPTWTNADVIVVGLNTACRFAPRLRGFWKDGKIRPEQLIELRRRFPSDAGQPRRVRILVAHHPFIEPPGGHPHGIVHGANDALRELERLGVDLILGGHLHLSYGGDVREQHPRIRRPIFNLLAGSATSVRRREPFFAYNIIQVEQGQWRSYLRKLENGRWRSEESFASPAAGPRPAAAPPGCHRQVMRG
ncbi:MAG: metallophosphoesterase [Phycisphaerales bacterium]|nr:metallophosphoesterase [Phycisphaerales bacterium]